MNLHRNISQVNTQTCRSGLIVDFRDPVHLEEVVSGTQGPELVPPTFTSAVGDKAGIGAGNSAELLGAIQVFPGRISLLQHPARTFLQNSIQVGIGQVKMSTRAHSTWAVRVQSRSDLFD